MCPKIERVIKITAFYDAAELEWGRISANDDVVKQSSIVDDYNAKLLSKKRQYCYYSTDIPKPNAAVVWGEDLSPR